MLAAPRVVIEVDQSVALPSTKVSPEIATAPLDEGESEARDRVAEISDWTVPKAAAVLVIGDEQAMGDASPPVEVITAGAMAGAAAAWASALGAASAADRLDEVSESETAANGFPAASDAAIVKVAG